MHHFSHTLGRDVDKAAAHYLYQSVALAVRERLMSAWHKTAAQESSKESRRTFYLSLEYLMGRTLGNALHNLEMTDAVHDALRELGIALEDIEQLEQDAGLGNGGLGRLAACFLDSAANLALPCRSVVTGCVTAMACSASLSTMAGKSNNPMTLSLIHI